MEGETGTRWALPPAQVILLDEKQAFEAQRDEESKHLRLAPWQIDAMKQGTPRSRSDGLFSDLLPHIADAQLAQAHLNQRVALLRQVEALRMFAATHHKKWPAQLEDTNLPLSVDPLTGKPFGYSIDGTKALLVIARASRGHDASAIASIRYEVSIEKEGR